MSARSAIKRVVVLPSRSTVEADFDAAKLGRVEADFEVVLAGERHAGDLHGDAGKRAPARGRRCGSLRRVLRLGGQRGLLNEAVDCIWGGGLGVGCDRRWSFRGGVMDHPRGIISRLDGGGFVGVAGNWLRLSVALRIECRRGG